MTHKLFFWLLATFFLKLLLTPGWQVQKDFPDRFSINVAATAAIELKPSVNGCANSATARDRIRARTSQSGKARSSAYQRLPKS